MKLSGKLNLFWLIFTTYFLLFGLSIVHAKTETIYASFKYTIGDNDTKNDARRIAFMEAKRRLIEKVGVFIESETSVTNSELSHDEVRSFTAAVIKVEVEKEDFLINGENQQIVTTVKADIDPDEVARTLSNIRNDKSLQKKIKEQQKEIKELEDKIKIVQADLARTDGDKVVQLRKERSIAFQQMNEIEKIKFSIQNATKTAIEVVERGMTKQEVQKVAGSPRAYSYENWNYGNVWVIFEGGVVGCIVDAKSNRPDLYSCSSHRGYILK